MNESPCKGCERRTARPNCHATCDDYKQFVDERHKINDERKKNSVIMDYVKDVQRKRQKRR